MKLFDAHCHVQDGRLMPGLDAVLARARALGIAGMACCGTSEKDWDAVATLAGRVPEITPSFGLHPWYVPDRSKNWLERLRAMLEAHPGAGVGEIGLDHAMENVDRDDQTDVFLKQFQLAIELGRPVSIHCRRAWELLPDVLKENASGHKGFIIHSYSGSAEMLLPLSGLGAHFSFSGSITYHRNKRAHKSLCAVPLKRLLLETDSPDLMPLLDQAGEPGADPEVNEPANLVLVLRAAARLRGIPEEELAEITFGNAERLFFMAS